MLLLYNIAVKFLTLIWAPLDLMQRNCTDLLPYVSRRHHPRYKSRH